MRSDTSLYLHFNRPTARLSIACQCSNIGIRPDAFILVTNHCAYDVRARTEFRPLPIVLFQHRGLEDRCSPYKPDDFLFRGQ